MQSEKNLKVRVLKYLSTFKNIWVYKTSDIWRSGIPDIIICFNGKFIAIELKKIGNTATPLQRHEIFKIRDAGGKARVCYCLEDVKNIIKQP